MSEQSRKMTTAPDGRERLIGNMVASMKSVPRRIQELHVQHFYKADPDYGSAGARALALNWNESNIRTLNWRAQISKTSRENMRQREIISTTLGDLIAAVTDEVTAFMGDSSGTYIVVSYIMSDLLSRHHARAPFLAAKSSARNSRTRR